MNKPVKILLPLELDEISGLNFYGKDTSLFAISDEKGVIYKIKPNISIQHWKFSTGADYEDITRIDSTFYILKSNGDISKVRHSNNVFQTESFIFPYGEDNEFEILYYDKSAHKLILMCKDCDADNKKTLTTFSFDPATNTFSDNSFSIDIKQMGRILNEKSIKFKPSAADINPRDSMLYIMSAINKILLITNRQGQVKNAYRIDPKMFKQPEGMTFTEKGDMVISNEFAKSGTADLLIFKYGQKQKQQ